MSDAYYEQQAKRRARKLWILGISVALVLCAAAGVVSVFYDACTKSFERSPEAVVSAYLDALRRGDGEVAQECWEHTIYYDLEAGCSEICLSRFLGAQYEVMDLSLGSPYASADNRTRLAATATIVCTKGGETHKGEILLDSVTGNLPWKHWAIINSTFGGTVAQPWCK